ncbi:hypothetical protein PPERSA_05802 [Pseudocohnilembus persalinus]|uniref:Transmembrane protein n=1 Tax=Pseudocohnilembus persalinus TaxID=266149 RepID=A0A0V0QZU8_PSEPJ|nr:hypothetical protein PPERSA_05802 [Pseudocohnilembus persalinus]|eukprot:KRX07739.1 hypothetical protein PPERSA_05802 [Pseudocohnilembus persalinus]
MIIIVWTINLIVSNRRVVRNLFCVQFRPVRKRAHTSFSQNRIQRFHKTQIYKKMSNRRRNHQFHSFDRIFFLSCSVHIKRKQTRRIQSLFEPRQRHHSFYRKRKSGQIDFSTQNLLAQFPKQSLGSASQFFNNNFVKTLFAAPAAGTSCSQLRLFLPLFQLPKGKFSVSVHVNYALFVQICVFYFRIRLVVLKNQVFVRLNKSGQMLHPLLVPLLKFLQIVYFFQLFLLILILLLLILYLLIGQNLVALGLNLVQILTVLSSLGLYIVIQVVNQVKVYVARLFDQFLHLGLNFLQIYQSVSCFLVVNFFYFLFSVGGLQCSRYGSVYVYYFVFVQNY